MRSRINTASISVIFDDSAVCRSSLASPVWQHHQAQSGRKEGMTRG